jgi:flagellum-specific ATP synthase
MNDVAPAEQLAAARTVRQLLSAYQEHEDLLSIGAYRRGSNRLVDVAVDMRDSINALLEQQIGETAPLDRVRAQLIELAGECRERLNKPTTPGIATAVPAT